MVTDSAVLKVLLVEDNPGDARLVEILLAEVEFASLRITHAERLGEAIEHLKETVFDVVLLDLSLPDASGLETVDRTREAAPRTPIVVFSGRDDEEAALQALQSGAQDYLVKGRGDGDLVARAIRYAIERKRTEERLVYMAHYDQLTGLTNRTLLQDRLMQALARSDRSGEKVTLLYLDLDRFKAVNDTLGHASGDEVLKVVAKRIKGRLRESDTAARMGGDEFAIILEDLSDAQDAASVARDLIGILSEPIALAGSEILVSASIGIAVHPPSPRDSMLQHADAAMYHAKKEGRNNHRFYTEEMNTLALERLRLEGNLSRAFEREEFELYYQPQVSLATGKIVGAEALLRWWSPDLGMVSPAEFVPLLEDTGMIVEVGEWVLRTACRQAKSWQQSGLLLPRVAVNISSRQLGRSDLVGSVARILGETGLEPACLELEITESLLMEDEAASSRMLNKLRGSVGGVRIAIDDFGTGYSSLSRLNSLTLDRLKIDRSFIRNIPADPNDAALTAGIIDLSHRIGLGVIAEGVETEEQMIFLRDQGCDEVQGFYLSHPVPADKFTQLVMERGMLPGAWKVV